jgi:hypothetical protein
MDFITPTCGQHFPQRGFIYSHFQGQGLVFTKVKPDLKSRKCITNNFRETLPFVYLCAVMLDVLFEAQFMIQKLTIIEAIQIAS